MASRQFMWAEKQQAAGKCRLCGKKRPGDEPNFCKRHAKMRLENDRKKRALLTTAK